MGKFEPTNDPLKADASPTKAFFVDIVTKDVQLDEAIQDLIDNCVDGAKRLRPNGDFTGLHVDLTVAADKFEIVDNCGGIPLDIARHYAFKFGRAAGFTKTDGSVGQFGIGMKRSIFKLGKAFEIETTEPKAEYKIQQDIGDWLIDDINWDFPILDLVEQSFNADETGTALRLSPLAEGVGTRFGQATFLASLANDLRARQADAMAKGLAISLNHEAIPANVWKVKIGDGLEPTCRTFEDEIGDAHMTMRVYAGVGNSDRHSAGWYIFCNGRCILEADQETTTGWSEVTDGGVRVPKYHNQFARFRGFAFLDAKDASILPWNTTKTGLDPESAAYKLLKPRLIEATRPVIDFLNALDKEFELEVPDRVLNKAVDRAPAQALAQLPPNDSFIYKEPEKRGPPMSRISYTRPKAETQRLMEEFGVKRPTDVGTKSFEYAYGLLVED